ncbi:MAG: transposase [Caldiserica bacterium]|nr:MAG: transposase [Caldisericota bacterium]
MSDEKIIYELTLLLIYLTSWEEEILKDTKTLVNWKNFRFEILDELEKQGLINQGRKTIYLTEKEISLAKEIKKKYNLKDD